MQILQDTSRYAKQPSASIFVIAEGQGSDSLKTVGKRMGTDNVQDLLREKGGHSPLQKLIRHTANQRAWTDQVKAALGDNLKNQVEVSDIKGTKLIIICRSAGVATKLRFTQQDLLEKLRPLSAFSQVNEVVFKVLG